MTHVSPTYFTQKDESFSFLLQTINPRTDHQLCSVYFQISSYSDVCVVYTCFFFSIYLRPMRRLLAFSHLDRCAIYAESISIVSTFLHVRNHISEINWQWVILNDYLIRLKNYNFQGQWRSWAGSLLSLRQDFTTTCWIVFSHKNDFFVNIPIKHPKVSFTTSRNHIRYAHLDEDKSSLLMFKKIFFLSSSSCKDFSWIIPLNEDIFYSIISNPFVA